MASPNPATWFKPISINKGTGRAYRAYKQRQRVAQFKQSVAVFRGKAASARFQGLPDSDIQFLPKNKFTFPTPTVPGFQNTPRVQLKLDQSLFSEVIEKLQDIKDAYIDELVTTIAEKTPVDTGRAKAGWIRNGDDIVNPVPYVKYLEIGTPNTRPIGMVASTMANSQRILDLIVSRFLK